MFHLSCVTRAQNQFVRAQATLASATINNTNPNPKPWSEVPSPPLYPIIGNGYLLFNKENAALHKLHAKLKQTYGNVYKTTFFGDTFLNIHDPEDLKTLLSKDGSIPVIPGFEGFIHMRKEHQAEYFGETSGLISQGEEWYKFRQAVQQDMMRPKSALYYIDEIEKIAVEFTDKVAAERDEKGNVKIGKFCQEFALDSITCIFLGGKIGVLNGSEDGKAMIQNMGIFMKYALPMVFFPRQVQWMPFYKKLVNASTEAVLLSSKHIKKALDTIDLEDGTDESVLAKLVRKHGKDSNVPVVMAMDAIGAGIDTTGHTATLLLYHLAKHPEKQAVLYQEISSVLGKQGHITSSSLARMRYLKACQTESQRMLPVTNGIARQTKVDMVLGGYQVPTGTKVIQFTRVTANSEDHFSSPEMFVPERWIRGHSDHHKADAFSNIPFGHGPRACIGQRFAKLELYVVLAKMIQRFKIEYHGEDVDIKSGLVGAPDKEIILSVKER